LSRLMIKFAPVGLRDLSGPQTLEVVSKGACNRQPLSAAAGRRRLLW
jgi:hypothetical protein